MALLLSVVVYLAIIAALAALGMLIASLVDSPQAAIAIALATLLPLSMISDIFVNAPEPPSVLSAIAWTFPLRHMAWLAAQTSSGATPGGEWLMHLGVIAAWARRRGCWRGGCSDGSRVGRPSGSPGRLPIGLVPSIDQTV